MCPLNNISFYYSAYIQFCQVLFLNNYICVNLVLDKIGKGVYNVIRTPRGAFTSIGYVFVQPPRGYLGSFIGILSEYLALKYGH